MLVSPNVVKGIRRNRLGNFLQATANLVGLGCAFWVHPYAPYVNIGVLLLSFFLATREGKLRGALVELILAGIGIYCVWMSGISGTAQSMRIDDVLISFKLVAAVANSMLLMRNWTQVVDHARREMAIDASVPGDLKGIDDWKTAQYKAIDDKVAGEKKKIEERRNRYA